MRLTFGAEESVASYLAQKTGAIYTNPFRTIGVWSGAALVTGIAFDCWTGDCVSISVAGRFFAHRSVKQAIGDMAFGALGCRRLELTTRQSNKIMRRIVGRMGFRFEGIRRLYYGDENGILLSLLSDEAVTLGHWAPQQAQERAA